MVASFVFGASRSVGPLGIIGWWHLRPCRYCRGGQVPMVQASNWAFFHLHNCKPLASSSLPLSIIKGTS